MDVKFIFTIIVLASTSTVWAQSRTESGEPQHVNPRMNYALPGMAIGAAAIEKTDDAVRSADDCNRIYHALKNQQDPVSALASRQGSNPYPPEYSSLIILMRSFVNNGLVPSNDEINEKIKNCSETALSLRTRHRDRLSQEISQIRSEALRTSGAVIGNVSHSFSIAPTDIQVPASISACRIVVQDNQCRVDNSIAAVQNFVLDAATAADPIVARFSAEDCACASNKFTNDRNGRSQDDMSRAKNELAGDLNNFILKSIGKKFINDYAANLEDLNYFLNERATVFGPASSPDKGIRYQCNQEQGYLAKIEAACKNSSVTPAEREARMKTLLSSWEKPPFTNFNQHMMNIGEDVLKINTPANSVNGGGPFTREKFDAFRYTELSNNKNIVFADRVAAKILANPELSTKFKTNAMTLTAEEAMIKVIAEEALKPNSFVTEMLRDSELTGSVIGQDLRSAITRRDRTTIEMKVINAFADASSNHPGFKLFMKDKGNLLEYNLQANSNSLIASLESESAGGFLDQKFFQQCDDLQKKFAEAVCTDSDKLIPKINPSELQGLVSEYAPLLDDDINVFNKLLCEKGGRSSDPLMAKLDVNHLPANERSDYLERLLKPEDSKDYFSVVMRLANGVPTEGGTGGSSGGASGSSVAASLGSYINSNAESRMRGETNGAPPRVSSSNSGRIGSRFLESPAARTAATTQSSDNSTSGAGKAVTGSAERMAVREDAEIFNPNQFSNQTSVSASGSAIPPISNNSVYSNRSDARSELRDSIINDSNKEEVDRLMTNIDDPSAKELSRLREENLKSRQELLELSTEAERSKLKALEQRMRDLQSERTVAAARPDSGESEEDVSNSGNRRRGAKRDVASVDDSLDNISSQQNFTTSGASAGVSSGSSVSAGGRASVAGDNGNGSNAVRPTFSNAGAIVISSNSLMNQGQEVKPQDMNNELLKFLTQGEPDISTLMSIKTSGMVYKFKVLENGQYVEKEISLNYASLNEVVKKLIDQKLAGSQGRGRSIASIDQELTFVKRTHSYLSLRLIIGEQARK